MLINISPRLWGESFWKMMHFVTLSYPDSNQNISEQDKTHVKDFFLSVKNVLPCENCRLHFEQNLEKFPLNDNILSSRDKFGFSTVRNFDKFEFRQIVWDIDQPKNPNSLLIGTDQEVPNEANIIKEIYGTNGYKYFEVVAN